MAFFVLPNRPVVNPAGNPAMADLSDTIEDVATGPAEVSGDSTRVRQQSVQDVIAADKYLAEKTASTNGPPFGMRLAKIQPGGAV